MCIRDSYDALGRTAYEARSETMKLGNVGAGYGAEAGRIKGGLGSASAITHDKLTVGAMMAVNPLGAAVDADMRLWAQESALTIDGDLEFGTEALAARPPVRGHPLAGTKHGRRFVGGNTSIGVVAVDADLTKSEAERVAIMAQDGLARAIRPIHTPFDGDAIFVLATGDRPLDDETSPRAGRLALLGALAADCVARAVGRAMWCAEDLGEMPCYRSLLKEQ